MTNRIDISDRLPLREDVALRPEFRRRCETAQRVVDLIHEALCIISSLPYLTRGPSPVLNRLRSCYRGGRVFGDRFASAAHLFETNVLGHHFSQREREIGAMAATKLAEAADLAWHVRRESLDEPTWTSLHAELAELNHFGGAIPSAGKLLAIAWDRIRSHEGHTACRGPNDL